jgi:fatty acid desaturase
MASLSLRWLATAIGLAALVPVAAFWLGRGVAVVGLSAACVLVIAASIFVMFGPSPPRAAG